MPKMQELYNKVSKDVALQEKFSAIMKDAETAGKEETEKKLAAFAKEAGYDVTVEEMLVFFKELAEKDKNELSDVELDMVAGGKSVGATAFSLLSVGLGCGIVSIIAAAVKSDVSCNQFIANSMNQEW